MIIVLITPLKHPPPPTGPMRTLICVFTVWDFEKGTPYCKALVKVPPTEKFVHNTHAFNLNHWEAAGGKVFTAWEVTAGIKPSMTTNINALRYSLTSREKAVLL